MDINTLTALGVALSFSIGLFSLGWQIYREKNKLPSENKQAQGDASESFANAAKLAADQNIELTKRLDLAEKRIEELEKNEREHQILVEDLLDHIDRLCHQVKSLGGEPVKRRVRTA
jgi:small-conductance mechanosensitive channel